MEPGEDANYVTPVPPRRPGGSSRSRWLGVLAGFAILIGVVVFQRHIGGAPTTAPSPTTTPLTTPTAIVTPTAVTPTTATPTTAGSIGPSTGQPASTLTATSGSSLTSTSFAWESSPTPSNDDLATTVTTFEPGSIPVTSGGWDILAVGWAALGRIDPATGHVVVVPTIPSTSGAFPQSIVSVAGRTFIGGGTPGIIVPDTGPAVAAPNLLRDAWQVLPGPTVDRLWVVADQPPNINAVVPVDWTGTTVGPAISLPSYLTAFGADIQSDGAGYLLARGVGGFYDIRPGSVRLITHGEVLATGPSGYLAYECGDTLTCQTVLIDRASESRRVVPMPTPTDLTLGASGSITADQRYAVLVQTTVTDTQAISRLMIVDLGNGKTTVVEDPISQRTSFSRIAFGLSADGACAVFPLQPDGVGIVTLATGAVSHLTLPSSFPYVVGLTTRVTG